MLGTLWFLIWQILGCAASLCFFSDKRATIRLWLGSVLGSVLAMWAPIPFSFLWGFTLRSHTAAALTGIPIAFALLLYRLKRGGGELSRDRCTRDRPLLWLLPSFLLLSAILLLNHTLVDVNGDLYTGQCTFGDMSMHLGFITSMAEQGFFPPLYSIFPYERLNYPFLCDSVSSSIYLLGASLRWAYMLPMFFAFAQVFAGFWFLAREVCRRRRAPVLAWCFFFLNGGLGMIYFLGGENGHSLRELFTGFYKTPTNLTAKGMRWVNVIADMLLPQRATLFGWALLLAILYLLFRAVFRRDKAAFLPAGVLAGLLPMIHTHSYLALGLMAACWMAYSAFRDGFSSSWLRGWLLFGLPAVALAVPQLLLWTLRSVSGNERFVRLHLDWVNHGQENWLWFWVKNVGPLFLIAPFAFIYASREEKGCFSGAILIFILCELLVFQPNMYDNNKLLYVGYFFVCFLCADAVLDLLSALDRPALGAALLAALMLLCVNAAAFTLARELISGVPRYGYRLISREQAEAAAYIRSNTEPDAVFLTADNHNNAVAALTGRNILCGSPSYLYFHGLDYSARRDLVQTMLKDPEAFEENRESLGIDYVFLGDWELQASPLLREHLAANYVLIYQQGRVSVFDLRSSRENGG